MKCPEILFSLHSTWVLWIWVELRIAWRLMSPLRGQPPDNSLHFHRWQFWVLIVIFFWSRIYSAEIKNRIDPLGFKQEQEQELWTCKFWACKLFIFPFCCKFTLLWQWINGSSRFYAINPINVWEMRPQLHGLAVQLAGGLRACLLQRGFFLRCSNKYDQII